MLMAIFWNACLLATALYVLLRGGRAERIGALAVVIASYASIPSTAFFGATEIGILAVDSLLLAVFIWLLVTTDRFWPIWATGFHMISVVTHLAVAIQPNIMPVAYANYAIFWSYLVLASLAWGTWDIRRR